MEKTYGRIDAFELTMAVLGEGPAKGQLHTPSKLAASVALCCVINLHIIEWHFIVASLRDTCAIIILSNQHLDVSHL